MHRPLNPRSREVYFIFHERGQDETPRRIQYTLIRTERGE